jgi:hypothetical protein
MLAECRIQIRFFLPLILRQDGAMALKFEAPDFFELKPMLWFSSSAHQVLLLVECRNFLKENRPFASLSSK